MKQKRVCVCVFSSSSVLKIQEVSIVSSPILYWSNRWDPINIAWCELRMTKFAHCVALVFFATLAVVFLFNAVTHHHLPNSNGPALSG